MKHYKPLLTVIFIVLCIASVSCGAKRERDEMVELGKAINLTKPGGQQIMDRFVALQNLKSPEDAQKFALELAALVVEIDDLIAPVKQLEIKSENVANVKNLYVQMWTNFQDGMKMVLEVIATRDPVLMATLEKRTLEKDSEFQSSKLQFETAFDTMLKVHEIKNEEIGEVAVPVPPPAQPQPQPAPQ